MGGDEEMDGERDATIGRDQSEQETSSAPCRCAAGTGTACSFTAPRHLPLDAPLPPPQTKYNNDELDLINSSAQFLEPQQGHQRSMVIFWYKSDKMKTGLTHTWSKETAKKKKK